MLRATTWGAGGGSGPLASNLERCNPGGAWWRGAGFAVLPEDVRPDLDASRGTSRTVAVKVPGTRGAARRGGSGRSGRGRTIARHRYHTEGRRTPEIRQEYLYYTYTVQKHDFSGAAPQHRSRDLDEPRQMSRTQKNRRNWYSPGGTGRKWAGGVSRLAPRTRKLIAATAGTSRMTSLSSSPRDNNVLI